MTTQRAQYSPADTEQMQEIRTTMRPGNIIFLRTRFGKYSFWSRIPLHLSMRTTSGVPGCRTNCPPNALGTALFTAGKRYARHFLQLAIGM